MERKARFRVIVTVMLILALVGAYGAQLFKLQSQATQEPGSYTYRTVVQAARGPILDRNGNVLVTNRASYNIQLNRVILLNADDPNQRLLELGELCESLGADYADHLPISKATPYAYTLDDLDSSWQNNFRKFLLAYSLDPDMSPQTLMKELQKIFGIPSDWTDHQKRLVTGLRYELALLAVEGTGLESYTLLADADTDTLSAIMELATPGLNVQTSTVRSYNTEYAAHILGYLGIMWREEYEETYKDLGYPMNATVGRAGIELAFEPELHGTDGTKVTTVNEDGEVLDEYWAVEPEAGDCVMLTIDINLQAAAEEALEKIILDLRENGLSSSSSDSKGKGQDAEGGALVAIDVKTGEVLACASYPTYSLETFYEDYATLSEDPYKPYYNRALQAALPPGSPFKMVTSIAAIDSAGIGRYYEIDTKGKYTYFDTYQPECLFFTNTGLNHGVINMMEALSVSCNYYFYEVGRQTGITAIDNVAKQLGLGEPTGVEIGESIGYRANPETKAEVHKDNPDLAGWYDADTVAASIGQSENSFTPMQLAVYTAALANQGKRYKATFLERIVSSDYTEVLVENEPVVANDYTFSDEAMAAVEDGMRLAVTEGTASTYLKNYDVAVCAKTGTAEHGSTGSAHGSFVCYAPMDDPQIAIAVYVEKGAQGGNLAQAAVAVMDEYFKDAPTDDLPGETVVG